MSISTFILAIIAISAIIAFLLERQQRLAAETGLRQMKASASAPPRPTATSAQPLSPPNNPTLEMFATADALDLIPRAEVLMKEIKPRSSAKAARRRRESANMTKAELDPPGLGPALEMQYQNAEQEISRRKIWLLEVQDATEDGLIVAYCERAQARRTFRIDRILTLTDMSTGHPIRNPASYFVQYIEPPEPIPEGHASTMTRSRPGRLVLTWIIRADGNPNADAIETIFEFIAKRSQLGGRTAADFNRDLARQDILDGRIVFEDAQRALSRIKRGGSEWHLVSAYASRLANADLSGAREKRRSRLFR